MAKDPSRTESASGSAAEGSRESLPRLSEVLPLSLHCVLIFYRLSRTLKSCLHSINGPVVPPPLALTRRAPIAVLLVIQKINSRQTPQPRLPNENHRFLRYEDPSFGPIVRPVVKSETDMF